MKHDVVYLLKNNYGSTEELKYSIRSVVQNFPYRKIVFVGGEPEGLKPDLMIPDEQIGETKWARSTHSLKTAIKSNELTDDIWLFNDDFFVMDRVREFEASNYFGGTLEKRCRDLRSRVGGSSYTGYMEQMRGKLIELGKDTLSFSLHVPFLINRTKAQALFEEFPNLKMFRSFYGNYYEIDCKYMKDVKIYDVNNIDFDAPFLSTSDDSFKRGKVGEFLRRYFTEPSDYEKSKEQRLREQTKEIYDEEGNERYG